MTQSTSNGDASPRRRGRPATSGADSHPIDTHVGSRLRAIRLSAGMTQDELARAVDLSFQQVQKYERGSNRVSASRLYELARVLGVEISFFFKGYKDPRDPDDGEGGVREDDANYDFIGMSPDREAYSILRALGGISNKSLRQVLARLVQSINEAEQAAKDDT